MKLQVSPKTVVWSILFALVFFLTCAAGANEQNEAIHIAVAGPFSGAGAEEGEAVARGIELYFKEVNGRGGINGKKLILDRFDDRNNPAQAADVAREIATASTHIAVIGHNLSSCSIRAGELYREYGIPALATAATNIRVTAGNPWYFRTIFNDAFQGMFLANYIKAIVPSSSVSIVHEDQAYGAYLAAVFAQTAKSIGLKVKINREFAVGDSALIGRLQQIVAELQNLDDAGIIFLATQPEAGSRFVEILRDAGMQNILLVPDAMASMAFPKRFAHLPKEKALPGFYTDGIYAATPLLNDLIGKEAEAFFFQYQAEYDSEPDWRSAFAYDAAKLIVAAIEQGGITGERGNIAADRKAVRDFLATLRTPEAAIPGATGLNYFDANGDPAKPIFMGMYLNRTLTSAFNQYRFVDNIAEFRYREEEFDPARLLNVGGKEMYRSDVVYAGIRPTKFNHLDLDSLTFNLDFYLWFRYRGDIDVQDIEFVNAVKPIRIQDPIDSTVQNGIAYRAYHLKGRFYTDYFPAPYGQHVLSVSFHHKKLTQRNLMFALDWIGMRPNLNTSRQQRFLDLQQRFDFESGWTVASTFFYQDIEYRNANGHPDYLTGAQRTVDFSRFNVGVRIRRPVFSLRGMISGGYANIFLILSLILFAFLAIARKRITEARFSRIFWILRVLVSMLFLMSAEVALGNWLGEHVTRYYLELMDRSFDVLWWLVPAFWVSTAVEQFIWLPLERKTHQTVPTILRHFVTSTIFLLAIFGVIAFVFDQKLTSLLATSGVIAMILGLAVQINISNIFSGIALNMERPFRISDWILVHGRTPAAKDGITGRVIDIGWRTTRVETPDNAVVIIPNSIISEKTVTNYMLPSEISAFEMSFFVDISFPFDEVIETMTKAVQALRRSDQEAPLDKPEFGVRVKRVAPEGIEYVLQYYTIPSKVSPAKLKHNLTITILEHFKRAGISLYAPKAL